MTITNHDVISKRHILILLAAGALLAVLASSSVRADIYIPPTGNTQSTIFFSQPIGESFTADATSYSEMGLWIKDVNEFAAPGDFTIQYDLYAGAGTAGALLDSQTVTAPLAGFSGFLDADFSSTTLTIGNVYSLVATQDTERWSILSGPDDYYAGGQLIVQGAPWINTHLEASFHATPEPSTLTLAAAGLFGLGGLALRRRHRRRTLR